MKTKPVQRKKTACKLVSAQQPLQSPTRAGLEACMVNNMKEHFSMCDAQENRVADPEYISFWKKVYDIFLCGVNKVCNMFPVSAIAKSVGISQTAVYKRLKNPPSSPISPFLGPKQRKRRKDAHSEELVPPIVHFWKAATSPSPNTKDVITSHSRVKGAHSKPKVDGIRRLVCNTDEREVCQFLIQHMRYGWRECFTTVRCLSIFLVPQTHPRHFCTSTNEKMYELFVK